MAGGRAPVDRSQPERCSAASDGGGHGAAGPATFWMRPSGLGINHRQYTGGRERSTHSLTASTDYCTFIARNPGSRAI